MKLEGNEQSGRQPVPKDIRHALESLGLLAPNEAASLRPLSGGVSSDIAVVTTDTSTFCIKRALQRLRTTQEWCVPAERSTFEARWLAAVGDLVPGTAPRLLGHHVDTGIVAMEYLPPDQYHVWKGRLLAGSPDGLVATHVGHLVGRIHAEAYRHANHLADQFDTMQLFTALRISPYLLTIAERHPDIAPQVASSIEDLKAHRVTLVHGDVSPKNILVSHTGQIKMVDAECAWWGDPAFDLAFCCNHLLLKQLAVPEQRPALQRSVRDLVQSYAQHIVWEPREQFFARAARLLPLLSLARVDGKSPVEYLKAPEQSRCRQAARSLILSTATLDLDEVFAMWERCIHV